MWLLHQYAAHVADPSIHSLCGCSINTQPFGCSINKQLLWLLQSNLSIVKSHRTWKFFHYRQVFTIDRSKIVKNTLGGPKQFSLLTSFSLFTSFTRDQFNCTFFLALIARKIQKWEWRQFTRKFSKMLQPHDIPMLYPPHGILHFYPSATWDALADKFDA